MVEIVGWLVDGQWKGRPEIAGTGSGVRRRREGNCTIIVAASKIILTTTIYDMMDCRTEWLTGRGMCLLACLLTYSQSSSLDEDDLA